MDLSKKKLFIILYGILLISYIGNSQSIEFYNPIYTSDSVSKSIESPSWSPDSKKIVFSALVDDLWLVYLYDIEEGNLIKISDSGLNEKYPTWHPNGSSIIYDRIDSLGSRLYLTNIISHEAKELFQREINSSKATYSESAALVCFLGYNNTKETWQLYTYDFVYDNLNQLTDHITSVNNPSFSPDGKHILYEYITETQDTSLRMINWYGSEELNLDTLESSSPSWNSNSWRFNFISRDINNEVEVYSLRRNGKQLVTLTDNHKLEKDFIKSPDGKYAAIIVEENKVKRLIIVEINFN